MTHLGSIVFNRVKEIYKAHNFVPKIEKFVFDFNQKEETVELSEN